MPVINIPPRHFSQCDSQAKSPPPQLKNSQIKERRTRRHIPVHVLQKHIVPQILLGGAVMKVLARKPQVELKPRDQSLDPLLSGQQRHHVVLSQSGALLADEYVVDVDQNHPIQAEAQLSMGQIG